MKPIGRVADSATETSATVILYRDLEKELSAENIILIKNGGDENPVNEVLGVLRKGVGRNEFLSASSYRPDVAYMRYGGEPSGSREVFSFQISLIGALERGEKKIKPNKRIIAPRSPVYLFDADSNPLGEYIAPSAKRLSWLNAYLDGHPEWKIPADAAYIPYHVGVFGSTGTGKSWFTRYVLVPFYLENGYKTLVLDWSGEDYAPYFKERTIHISKLAHDEEAMLKYFSEVTGNFGDNNNLRDAFDEFLEGWVERVKDKEVKEVYEELREHAARSISSIGRADWKSSAERAMRRVFRKLKHEHIMPLMGTVTIDEFLFEAEELRVVDMSGFSSYTKLSFFLTLSMKLQELMNVERDLRMALIIDEAPQYVPFKPEGIQQRATEEIKNLAALGRKHNLNLTLIAQGIAGEIGINAAVRRNLNTNFYGRLHPLDAAGEGGAKDWLGPYGITPEYMLNLEDGRFYFAGIMNPSPIPLLITFEPGGEVWKK